MEREVYDIDKEMWGDYTSSGPWELDGEIYMMYIGNEVGRYGFGLAKLIGSL